MITIKSFDPDHYLLDLQILINHHLEAVIPGWALPAQAILKSLTRNHHESLIDTWVIERKTLCAVDNGRFLGAAHLLRYGAGEDIGEWYRNDGAVAWFFVEPDHAKAGAALLQAAHEQMITWRVKAVSYFDNGLPISLISDLPDCWPHIAQLLADADFTPVHPRQEAIFGGWLRNVPLPEATPIPNLTICRIIQDTNLAFAGFVDDQKIGWCEITADLSAGGDLPTMRGWSELTEMYVAEAWRNRGLGTWLVQHAVEWMWLSGCDRIALNVDGDDEARGAGRFYERFGWQTFTRMERGLGYNLLPEDGN